MLASRTHWLLRSVFRNEMALQAIAAAFEVVVGHLWTVGKPMASATLTRDLAQPYHTYFFQGWSYNERPEAKPCFDQRGN